MSTPFDSAIRICRQELDKIRVEVAQQADKVEQLNSASAAVDMEVRAEADLVRDEFFPFVNYGAFAQRKRDEKRAIEVACTDARAQLDVLVDRTQDAFGDYKTLDTAATRWQDGRAREASRREQNATDELASQAYQRTKAA